jgi:transcriptional regulator with XRE-family HTH domain
MAVANGTTTFGIQLRRRRHSLGLSQLQLAADAGVSPRHLSFIETGRARPSRQMVLRLAERLRVPLRDRNQLLLAAGFAPAYQRRDLHAPELGAVHNAAVLVLRSHEPFPAVALDRRRDIVMANQAAARLRQEMAPALRGAPLNIYRLLLHPDGLARRIVGFRAYAQHLLARLRDDAETTNDPDLGALLSEVTSYAGVDAAAGEPSDAADGAALTLRLRDGAAAGGQLAFVTTVATFGTPLDLTVSELVIESLVPADAATAARLRALAGERRA